MNTLNTEKNTDLTPADALRARIKVEQIIAFWMLLPVFIMIGLKIFIISDMSGKMEGMVQTTATVTRVESYVSYEYDNDGDTLYKVYVKYYYNDKPYETVSDVNDPSYNVGDVIDFWYDPNDPDNTSAGTDAVSKSMAPVFLIICLICSPIPLILIIDSVRCRIRLNRIK